MTLKLKSTTNELWKGWKLAWYHHFTHIACAKKLRGYGKNWMHFVYKMDNLFRSIRVSDENSSVTKGFHFFDLFELQTFLCSKCSIQSEYWPEHPVEWWRLSMVTAQRDTHEEEIAHPKILLWDVIGFTVITFFSSEFPDLYMFVIVRVLMCFGTWNVYFVLHINMYLSDIICYFSCIYWIFWAKWPWNWKALQMNSEKVESWHGVVISPT